MTEQVPEWMIEFARCEPFIRAALEYDAGTHDLEDVLLLVAKGDCQFWPGERSAIITEIARHPKMAVCHFWLAGGDIHELELMSQDVEKWAREQGCARITLAGRKGWTRSFLAKHGYESRWTIMSKEL